MERFFLERLVSGRRHSAVAGESAGLLTQPQGSHGGCSSMLCSEEEEAVCCVSQVAYASSVRADAVTVERTACLGWLCRCWWAQQWPIARTGGVSLPPSSLASSSEAAALLQGEEDGSPGTVDLSNPAVRQG